MRRFRSIAGDVYVGNVVRVHDNGSVIMSNYSVWYYGESQPVDCTKADDTVQFILETELPL